MKRRLFSSFTILIALLILGFLPLSVAPAIAFTFTTIDVPGGTDTRAFKINGDGQIVGNYVASGVAHGFVATPNENEDENDDSGGNNGGAND